MPKMSKLEKRGARQLEDPPKSRAKRLITVYIHYDSMGGERLAYRCEVSAGHAERMRFAATRPGAANVVDHSVWPTSGGYRVVNPPESSAEETAAAA